MSVSGIVKALAVFGRTFLPHIRYVIGIDEAGRGPLAGPVAVGVVAVPIKVAKDVEQALAGVRDSKQVSSQQRELWVEKTRILENKKLITSTVALVGAKYIDEKGIVPAIRTGITRALARLSISPCHTYVLLDGSLQAPQSFESQETIIHGDSKEPLISLASILAKVRRDKYMVNLARRIPEYGFDRHKGYGTAEHMRNLRKYGTSALHRESFIHL